MGYRINELARPRDAGTVDGWKITEHPTARNEYRFQAVFETDNHRRFVRSAATIGELGLGVTARPRAALSRLMLAAGAIMGGRP